MFRFFTIFIALFLVSSDACGKNSKVRLVQRLDGVPDNVILNNSQKAKLKDNLKGLISINMTPRKNDYVDDFNRGTVEFNPTVKQDMFGRVVFVEKNYSYQKVKVPDGSYIVGVNFNQKTPHTNAIKGKDLTLERCTIVNVEVDSSWVLIDTYERHMKHEVVEEGDRQYQIILREIEGEFVEIQRKEIIPE